MLIKHFICTSNSKPRPKAACTIVCDFDGCLAESEGLPRAHWRLNAELVQMLRAEKQAGAYIVLSTARGAFRTGDCMTEQICHDVELEICSFLQKHALFDLFDEMHIGRKAPGDIYIEDKGCLPNEFKLQA